MLYERVKFLFIEFFYDCDVKGHSWYYTFAGAKVHNILSYIAFGCTFKHQCFKICAL